MFFNLIQLTAFNVMIIMNIFSYSGLKKINKLASLCAVKIVSRENCSYYYFDVFVVKLFMNLFCILL